MEDEEDLLLDTSCAGDEGYALSEGGDSLLDSEGEEEERCNRSKYQQPLTLSSQSPSPEGTSLSQEMPSQPNQWSFSGSPPPSSENQSQASPTCPLLCTNVMSTERSRVIRLDGKKKFRYVADILPDVPLPRRAVSRKKHVVTRPRRLTKPSLLLEPKRLLISEPASDLRNTLVANRMSQCNRKEPSVARIVDGNDCGGEGMRTRGEPVGAGSHTEGSEEKYAHQQLCTGEWPGTNQPPSLYSLPSPSLFTAISSNSLFTQTTVSASASLFNQSSAPATAVQKRTFISVGDSKESSECGVSAYTLAQTISRRDARPLTIINRTAQCSTANHSLLSKPSSLHRPATVMYPSSDAQRCLTPSPYDGHEPASSSSKSLFSFKCSFQPTPTASLFRKTPAFALRDHASWPHSPHPLPTSHSPALHHPPSPPPPPRAAKDLLPVNPFYSKIQQLPRQSIASQDEAFNPFLTALQKEAVVQSEDNPSNIFSFSLTQITS